jgi:hypothetical protein
LISIFVVLTIGSIPGAVTMIWIVSSVGIVGVLVFLFVVVMENDDVVGGQCAKRGDSDRSGRVLVIGPARLAQKANAVIRQLDLALASLASSGDGHQSATIQPVAIARTVAGPNRLPRFVENP